MARLRSPMRRLAAAKKRAARRPGAARGDIRSAVRPGAKAPGPGPGLKVRRARAADIPGVVALDERVTGLAKPDYWQDVFERYGRPRLHERMFLVAHPPGTDGPAPLLGFVVGEVRAWEFGSAPCGWVLALSVEPRARLRGIGRALVDALSRDLRAAGVTKMRTMVARGNRLHLLFFRAEGMTAGPYLQLEKDLD
jgi:ribosomal protein S18 acetylase RimI-like enzyme